MGWGVLIYCNSHFDLDFIIKITQIHKPFCCDSINDNQKVTISPGKYTSEDGLLSEFEP